MKPPARPKIVGDYLNLDEMAKKANFDGEMLVYGNRVAVMGDETSPLEWLMFAAAVHTYATRNDENGSIMAAVIAGRDEDGLLKLVVVDTLPVAGLLVLHKQVDSQAMNQARESAAALALAAWRTLSAEEYESFVSWYGAQHGRRVGEARSAAPEWLVPYLDMAAYIYNRNAAFGNPSAMILPLLGKDPEAGLNMMAAIGSLDDDNENDDVVKA